MFFQALFKIYIRAAIVVFCLISQCVFAASQMTVVDMDLTLLSMSGTWKVLASYPADGKRHPKSSTLDDEDSFSIAITETPGGHNITVRLYETALRCHVELEILSSIYFKHFATVAVKFNDYDYLLNSGPDPNQDCAHDSNPAVAKVFAFRMVNGPNISSAECQRRVKEANLIGNHQRRRVCGRDLSASWVVKKATKQLNDLLNTLATNTTGMHVTALREYAKTFASTRSPENITYRDLSEFLFKVHRYDKSPPEDAQGTATGSM